MADYQKMYHIMFNAATDAERKIREAKLLGAANILRTAQAECEGLYIETDDEPTTLHMSPNNETAGK